MMETSTNSNNDEIWNLLHALPESIRRKPAVTATLARVYQERGIIPTEQQQLNLHHQNSNMLADLYLAQGDYTQAVELYQKQVNEKPKDTIAVARLVRALSYVEPERAVTMWKGLQITNDVELDNDIDGAELEQRELPKLKSKTRKGPVESSTGSSQVVTKKKKSHEAVLRRRARKRDEYLTALDEKGLYRKDRPSKPDPERWIPKYERAYSRRRRHRGTGAAQGGVSEKEAAKLDVAARQKVRESGDGGEPSTRSTAHMTVTSSGQVSKKKKKR
jgi:signal recognition particle subunit SRP72